MSDVRADAERLLKDCELGPNCNVCRTVRALLAELDRQGPGAWRPIAEAPKDGTPLLLYRAGKSIVQGCWNSGGAMHMPHWMTPSNMFDPTHFIPLSVLPLPPAPSQEPE